MKQKLALLSADLREQIVFCGRDYKPSPKSPVSNWLVDTKRHCNGGRTVDAGLWLKKHCDDGGKIFLTMSGAGSTFEQGIMIGELIRAGKIAAISVTGANLEESLYRLVAHSDYAYIPNYQKLSRAQEKELDVVGLRRITDTFLPEDESTRIVLPEIEKLWRESDAAGEQLLWHEYFFRLLQRGMLTFDPCANSTDCWIYQAWRENIPIFVPGWEDSTMGNIFTQACCDSKHQFLSKYKSQVPINRNIILPSVCYMHQLAEWYMDNTKEKGIAFLQLGGGIAADFPICVVPHLKKDWLALEEQKIQDKLIRSWAGFIEVHDSTMSYGSYSGAGADEKVTWGKLEQSSYGVQIAGDYTLVFPDITALVLGK